MTCALKNRGPFQQTVLVQDGWNYEGWIQKGITRNPNMKIIPFRMSNECEFQRDDKYQYTDCMDCSLKTQPQEIQA